MEEIKLTSEEWKAKLFANNEVVIMDPDGWDRSAEGWEYSWYQEKITENEFMMRVMRSTCMYNIHPADLLKK